MFTRPLISWTALATAAALAGCTQFPELDETITPAAEAADYPELVPLGPLLDAVDAAQVDAPATETELTTRADALRARADQLRGPIVSPQERARLEETVE